MASVGFVGECPSGDTENMFVCVSLPDFRRISLGLYFPARVSSCSAVYVCVFALFLALYSNQNSYFSVWRVLFYVRLKTHTARQRKAKKNLEKFDAHSEKGKGVRLNGNGRGTAIARARTIES